MKRILVTGGSGKLGRACIRDLLAHGFVVFNGDAVAPAESLCPFIPLDIENMGQTMEALSGVEFKSSRGIDAVVHLAGIPAPARKAQTDIFRVNSVGAYNLFEGARRVGVKNIVWASSETLLGIPFETPPPYLPVDEEYEPRPETAYALSKLMGETLATQFCRWDPTQKIVGLRLSSVMDPQEYPDLKQFWEDIGVRRRNLWAYIDVRDAAQAVRKALIAEVTGAHNFVVAAGDTMMREKTADLVAQYLPQVRYQPTANPYEGLLSNGKAARVLGYTPRFTWRTELSS